LEQAAISKIESGYRDISDVETAAIAKALGVTIDWLFDEGEHAQNKRRNKPSQNNKRILS
jgi:transcriptional regulator with XRE-family HTH domain